MTGPDQKVPSLAASHSHCAPAPAAALKPGFGLDIFRYFLNVVTADTSSAGIAKQNMRRIAVSLYCLARLTTEILELII